MKRTTMSVCRDLLLYPVTSVYTYSRIRSEARFGSFTGGIEADAIPGTITLVETEEEDVKNRKITYQAAEMTPEAADRLSQLKKCKLIAVYTDESGRRRVAGSPSWPTALDYTSVGGVNTVVLTYSDTEQDAFLA